MKYVFSLCVPVFLFYCAISGILTSGALPAILTALGVSFIFYFKNKPALQENVDAVLGSSSIQIIAHRGGAIDAPENTLEAIKEVRMLYLF